MMFTPRKMMILFVVSGACCFGMLWAQQEETVKPDSKHDNVIPQIIGRAFIPAQEPIQQHQFNYTGMPTPRTPGVISHYYGEYSQPYLAHLSTPPDSALSKALKDYRDSKPDSNQRKEARDQVAKCLADTYDEMLSRQEKQIEELADRLEKLRTQMVKRREGKARMVELKLEMILSQADGLGWPGDPSWVGGNGIGEFTWSTMQPPPAGASGILRPNLPPNVGRNEPQIPIYQPSTNPPAGR